VPAPVLWGNEETVRQRLSPFTSSLKLTRQRVKFSYPFAPREVVALFREYFGPTKTAFARLDKGGQDQLASQLEKLWAEHNEATDGTTIVEAEYLDVRAARA
jgi:hypothetical protein